MQGSDWKVRSANSTESTLTFVRSDPTWSEVVFVDLSLRDNRGLDLIRNLSNQAMKPRIVAAAGSATSDLREEFVRLGVEFLPKPFRFDEFETAIEKSARHSD